MQTAERLFMDNVTYNRNLSKARTKPKHSIPRQGMVFILTPDEVIEVLRDHGLDITRRTLFNWEKAGLVPEAERGSFGQGGGKWSDYPDETIPEALTAHLLKGVYRLKHAEIARAREGYNMGKLKPYSGVWGAVIQRIKEEGYSQVQQTISPSTVRVSKGIDELVNENPKALGKLIEMIEFFQSDIWRELEERRKTGEISGDMSMSEALKIIKSLEK